jgi:hypothetical protein
MERRVAPRKSVVRLAAVEFGFTSLRGVVLDLSATGARIYLPPHADVPELVTLRLPDGVTRGACCRWQRDDEAGFQFLPGGSQGTRRSAKPDHPQAGPF